MEHKKVLQAIVPCTIRLRRLLRVKALSDPGILFGRVRQHPPVFIFERNKLMDIFEKLTIHENWMDFLEYKAEKSNLRKQDLDDLRAYVTAKEYEPVVNELIAGEDFGLPEVLEINKNASGKKRIVFTFERSKNYVLKMITFLLSGYDDLFEENLYSFRNNTGVKDAIQNIIRNKKRSELYTYKADIHDYFNSIDYRKMLDILKEVMPGEGRLISFLERIWSDPCALKNGNRIEIKKGVMAGTPVAGFMANLYLADMDRIFARENIMYARYSDDIIVFSDTEEKIRKYEGWINDSLGKKGLLINEKKVFRTLPGEEFEFLGFEFYGKQINISPIAEKKIKDKLKRKARALYRWKIRKNADDDRTVRAFLRKVNKKFYDNPVRNEITWSRWYFPVITKDDRLREIDEYVIQCARYLCTGKYGKKNYNLRYEKIRELGFRSLVNTYWKEKW